MHTCTYKRVVLKVMPLIYFPRTDARTITPLNREDFQLQNKVTTTDYAFLPVINIF